MSGNGSAVIKRPRQVGQVEITMLAKAQVEKHYKLIMAGIAHAYGDAATEELVTNIMAGILDDRTQVWIVWADGPKRQFLGALTTQIVHDREMDLRFLYVKTLGSFGIADRGAWARGMEKLQDFAALNGCRHIQADIMNPKVATMAARMGFQQVSIRMLKEV
jgi:hypothetical protein